MTLQQIPINYALQNLRAIAIIGVLAYHLGFFFTNGYIGVDIFFVISGFILTEMAIGLREKQKFSTKEKTYESFQFIFRRLKRLFPSLALMILAVTLITSVIDTPDNLIHKTFISSLHSLLFSSNYYFISRKFDYFNISETQPFLHTWSLSAEFQIYVIFAFTFFWSTKNSMKNYKLWISTLGILSFFITLFALIPNILNSTYQIQSFSYFSSITRLWQFCLGSLVSIFASKLKEVFESQKVADVIQVISFCGILMIALPIFNDANPVLLSIFATLFSSIVICSAFNRNSFFHKLKLVAIGNRAYSLYLYVLPLPMLSSLIFGQRSNQFLYSIIVSIILAEINYRLVEKQRRLRSNKSFVYVLVLIIFFMGLLFNLNQTIRPSSQFLTPLRATELDSICERQRGDNNFKPCVYGEFNGSRAILVGDSHAAALSEVFIRYFSGKKIQSIVATGSACTLTKNSKALNYRPSCIGYFENVSDYINRNQVKYIFISHYTLFYIKELGISHEEWIDGLNTFLDNISVKNAKVVIIGDNPDFKYVPGRLLWVKSWEIGDSLVQQRIIEQDSVNDLLLNDSRTIKVVEIANALCSIKCPVYYNQNWLYTDNNHLSVKGSMYIFHYLEKTLNDFLF